MRCVQYYLSPSDKPWRKFVIYFESVYKMDLKSVRVRMHANETNPLLPAKYF